MLRGVYKSSQCRVTCTVCVQSASLFIVVHAPCYCEAISGDGGGCVGVASPGSVPSSVRLSLNRLVLFLVVCLVEVDSCLETWWWGVGGMVVFGCGNGGWGCGSVTSPVGPFPVGHCVVGADDGCGFLLISWFLI